MINWCILGVPSKKETGTENEVETPFTRTKKSARHSKFLAPYRWILGTALPIYTHKKFGTAPQILGTVPVNFGHGTPNYRRANVSVPKKVWHWCPNFYCTASLFRHRASIGGAETTSARSPVPNFFWYRYVCTSVIGSAVPKLHRYGAQNLGCRADFFVRVNGV